MTETLTTTWADTVGAALDTIASLVTPEGNSRWTFALGKSGSPLVKAEIAGGWLVLETDHPSPDAAASGPAFFWDALAANATLPGFAKSVLPIEGPMRLGADLPLHEDLDIAARIRAACVGFEFAWSWGQPATAGASSADSPNLETIHLKQICSEAGWPFVERASGKLAVELEVAPGFYQALLVPTGKGVRVSCDLTDCDVEPLVCREATGRFLLAASGAVRLARAAIAAGEVSSVARFEVVFSDPPGPRELARALESLSVGCSLCGDEIKMLQDANVARRYLEIRGWM